MNISGLSLGQTPPLSVPAPFLLTAPLFGVAAGLLLLLQPGVLQNRWFPGTLALTHLVTLGFLAMVMAGALQQLLPVVAGAPITRPRLVGTTVHLCLTGGAVGLVAGFLSNSGPAFLVAMALLGCGFLVLAGAAAWALLGTRSTHATPRAVGVALAGLLVTVAFGLHLLAGHAGLAPLARHLTDLHAQWGLLGWVALLVMGVAYQVVPMFQVTPDYPRPLTRGLVPLLFVALAASSLPMGLGPAWTAVADAAVALGVAGFAATTLLLQARRRRRLPDVTLDFWRVAMGALLAAVGLWLGATLTGAQHPATLLGVLFLGGFAISAANGMLYKIVPFLVWLHLNNRVFAQPGLRGRVPHMKQVIPERRSRAQFRAHVAALLALAVAAAVDQEWIGRVAGVLFAASAALLTFNLWSALFLFRRLTREAGTAVKGDEV